MSDMGRELLMWVRGVVLVAGLVHVLSCCSPGLCLGMSMSLSISLSLHLRLGLGLRHVHLVLHVCLDLLCVVEGCRLEGHVVLLLLLVVLGWEVLRMLVHRVVLGRRVVIKTEIFVIIALGIQVVIVVFIDDRRRRGEGQSFDLDRTAWPRLVDRGECLGVTLTIEQLLVLSGPPGRGLCAANPAFVALPSRMNPLHLSIRRS
jgi:hypothetical protein